MQMKQSHRVGQIVAEAILLRGGLEPNRIPSDFLAVRIALDFSTERRREDLRAEAYAEHRQIALYRIFDQRHLVAQPRIAIGLINAHRTADHDQAARALHVARHWLAVVDPHALPRERGAFERVGDGAED